MAVADAVAAPQSEELQVAGVAAVGEGICFAVNAVMYALCLDYKTEQAHIDYILRTRRFPR